jgi:protein gp37
MGKSRIEWTEAVWSPVTGCEKVSAGCKHCYAEREWGRFQHLPAYAGRKFTDVAVHPERLNLPLRWRRPRKVFVNPMSDLFHEAVPIEFIDQIFAIMGLCFVMDAGHTFQVLTKRPERMLAYMLDHETVWRVAGWMKKLGPKDGLPGENSPPAWPLPNVWLGTSIEDQATADERIPLLLRTPAAVRWVSAEPLIGPVDLSEALGMAWNKTMGCYESTGMQLNRVGGRGGMDWLALGGESGSKARPMSIAWARTLRDQCQAAGVPFYFKQWGEFAPALSGTWFYPLEGNPQFLPRASGTDTHNFWNILGDMGGTGAVRIGKRNLSRELDGVVHDAYPEQEVSS